MASRWHFRVSSLILLLIVALVFAWGLTRCALFDRSLLTDTPCAPPCWYGIVPGETSEEETIRILENLSFINPASIRVHSEPSRKLTDIGWDYLPKLREADSGLIGIEDGVVRTVLVLFYPPRSMKLSQLLEAQIPPEVAITDVNPDNSLSLTLVFPSKGFAVYCSGIYVGTHDVSVNASHKLRVLNVTYFQPMSLTDYFAQVKGTGRLSAEEMVKYRTQPWPGFGGELKLPSRR